VQRARDRRGDVGVLGAALPVPESRWPIVSVSSLSLSYAPRLARPAATIFCATAR
jgi:hypothetical protein